MRPSQYLEQANDFDLYADGVYDAEISKPQKSADSDRF